MEEKIQEIINEGQKQVDYEETKVSNLRSRIAFCKAHNFEEEERVARLKLDAKEMVVYRYSQTLKELQDTLNAWNS
jgi:hypothetical protein